ncbi:MAG: ribosome maturation factor RimM [Pseudomonadales bacterium]
MSCEDQLPETRLAESIIIVGRIQGPYGIKGWVHVAAYTDPASNLVSYRPWKVQRSTGQNAAKSVADPDWQDIEVVETRAHKGGYVARVHGVNDRNAAESLRGLWIGVHESQLPQPAVGEYYWKDLIGVEVCDQSDVSLGRVTSLIETGAHDVLVVRGPGASDEEFLIPFHPRYVVDVDLAAGSIRVDWRDG